MSTYSERLQNPNWQKKRLDILSRDNWSCIECGDGLKNDVTLQVHHKEYIFGRAPWEYENENFETLCGNCHANRHDKKGREPKPAEEVVIENSSLIAAFNILSVDLQYEINRLFKSDVDIDKQLYFLMSYQNVQVEDYLIWHSFNNPVTAKGYQAAVRFLGNTEHKAEPYEIYCHREYFGLRVNLIRRVLDVIISDNINLLKDSVSDERQDEIISLNQKLITLRAKFIPYAKQVREKKFKPYRK